MVNRYLPPSESLSNQSMVHSFMVQNPYGNGHPEFMSGGTAPSHFIRQGLMGVGEITHYDPSMAGLGEITHYDPRFMSLGEFEYKSVEGLGALTEVAKNHWKKIAFGVGAVALTAWWIKR